METVLYILFLLVVLPVSPILITLSIGAATLWTRGRLKQKNKRNERDTNSQTLESIKMSEKNLNVPEEHDVASVVKTTAAASLEEKIKKELEIADPTDEKAKAILDDSA
jgi:flagellar biosynthesis component FlhA